MFSMFCFRSCLRVGFGIICLLLPFICYAEQKQGKVTKVRDGDTVVIGISHADSIRCRLYGIDTPEKKQPYGIEAKAHLANLILYQTIEYQVIRTDRHGRGICIITHNGRDINLEMVSSGHAWAYVQYLERPHASKYIDAERTARSKRLGLWQDYNPIPPWEFRKLQRR